VQLPRVKSLEELSRREAPPPGAVRPRGQSSSAGVV
jgi:hypothetical protein